MVSGFLPSPFGCFNFSHPRRYRASRDACHTGDAPSSCFASSSLQNNPPHPFPATQRRHDALSHQRRRVTFDRMELD